MGSELRGDVSRLQGTRGIRQGSREATATIWVGQRCGLDRAGDAEGDGFQSSFKVQLMGSPRGGWVGRRAR